MSLHPHSAGESWTDREWEKQELTTRVLVYIWSFLGLEGLKFTLLECLIFGSTLSATDPVTILAIFNQYKVDPKLYSVIFGESILNDAVSIVMYEWVPLRFSSAQVKRLTCRTLSRFHGEDIYVSSLFHGVGIFLFSFAGSMFLGVAFGLCCSLGLKHSHLASYPHIESCIVALVAYTSYFFSNGLSMSGEFRSSSLFFWSPFSLITRDVTRNND